MTRLRLLYRALSAVCAMLAISLAPAATALAEPTDITVRVLSKGAKFIGTGMGGVRVTLRDAQTGEMLAKGKTSGATGDTRRIMKKAQPRGAPLSSEDAAKFTATLDLARPRLIEVEAYGPLAQRQSAVTVTSTQWVVPGKHVTGGDGWLLEMPGLAVDIVAPQTPAYAGAAPKTITLTANVVTMCGCPITPGGQWDANAYEVAAMLVRDGEVVRTVPLSYAGTPSRFETKMDIWDPGAYEAIVYAYDPTNGSTGLDHATFAVR